MAYKGQQLTEEEKLNYKNNYKLWRNTENGIAFFEKEKQKIEIRKINYEKNPKLCNWCKTPISYEKRENNFCNRSCSANYTNKHRAPQTKETNEKISKTMKRKVKNGTYFYANPKCRIETECIWCHIKFSIRPYELKRKKYCCKKCFLSDPNRKCGRGL